MRDAIALLIPIVSGCSEFKDRGFRERNPDNQLEYVPGYYERSASAHCVRPQLPAG